MMKYPLGLREQDVYARGWNDAVAAERERCAGIADCLAEKWEASAAKLRAAGTRRGWGFFGQPHVLPAFERDAEAIESAAKGLRAVSQVIRSGARKQ